MKRLNLPNVTLVAATSVNVAATLAALERSLAQIDVHGAILLTDAAITSPDPRLEIVPISPLTSSRAYSDFILSNLADHVGTSHCLIIQWDGFVVDARQWQPTFLDLDYVGAPWPQFTDGHNVGNGGFSLRSRRLLEACRDPHFVRDHPEDVAVCRTNRELLESKYDLRFADRSLAAQFAFERASRDGPTFGFHGIFNMIPVLGADAFWSIYRTLDDRGTASVDHLRLMRQLGIHPSAWPKQWRLTMDRLNDPTRRPPSIR